MILRKFLSSTTFAHLWDIMITLLTFYLAIIIPYNLALRIWPTQLSFGDTFIMSVIFALDIFFSIYFLNNQVRFRYASQAERNSYYFRNWFVFDLLAAIPFGVFMNSLWQILRLTKLIRVRRIVEEWQSDNLRYNTQFNLVILCVSMMLIAHWLSCGWLVIRGLDEALDHTNNYVNALYWSVTTITTVGYGDITPQNMIEKIYVMFTMLIGFGFYGFLIGNISNLLAQRNPAREHYHDNMEHLSNMVRYRGLPKELQQKIREYYTYKLQRQIGYDETNFLDSLPENLRRKVALYLKKDLLEDMPLFKHANEAFIEALALLLKPIVFTPGDYVFRAGDIGHEMFFIVQGELRVLAKDEETILSTMTNGDCFGEIALFRHKPRTASIMAETYCDIYSLSKSAFDEVVQYYPYFAKKIEEMVNSRE